MGNLYFQGEMDMNKSRIYVDFNEMVTGDIVLLSKENTIQDSDGHQIVFYDGMPVSIYSDDNKDGKPDNLIADGIAIKYDLSNHPNWSHIKWCCKIDEKGILHESVVDVTIKHYAASDRQ